jgi:alcohol dehydrogenase class IV
MIVRWGIAALAEVLDEAGIKRPLLVSTTRWESYDLPVEHRFYGALPHAAIDGVGAAIDAAREDGVDGLVPLGGGSVIDTAKAVSAKSGLSVVSIPTTYSGAEWSTSFGMRNPATGIKGGGSGAHMVGVVYETELTLDLPRSESGGTALNALAHCAEALYVPGRTKATDAEALAGAERISRYLPAVLEDGHDLASRHGLLEGAMHGGGALLAGMGVGHAMAQALGGRYGLAHGTMNAVCLPHALRFNAVVAADAVVRFGAAMDRDDPITRVSELAALAGPAELRAYGVPYDELGEIAALTAERPAARANPRPASTEEILELLRAAW